MLLRACITTILCTFFVRAILLVQAVDKILFRLQDIFVTDGRTIIYLLPQMLSGCTGVKCCLTPSLGEKSVGIVGGLLGKGKGGEENAVHRFWKILKFV